MECQKRVLPIMMHDRYQNLITNLAMKLFQETLIDLANNEMTLKEKRRSRAGDSFS
jgi:hypothetical protein